MKRTFNYTDRKRIARNAIRIIVERFDAERVICSASCDLGGYSFPLGSEVALEAYYRELYRRVQLGSNGDQLSNEAIDLSEFAGAPRILFRLKVLEPGGGGVLIGLADRIPLERPDAHPDSSDSLLRVRPGEIGERVWDVQFESEPILVINEKFEDWRGFVSSNPLFIASVMPAALDRVLQEILIDREHEPESGGTEWPDRWLTMCEGELGVPIERSDLNDIETKRAWIDRAVEKLCDRHRMFSMAQQE